MNKQELHDYIKEKEPNICQVTGLIRHSLKYLDTFNDYTESDCCHVMSVTKSIVSLLVGIALDQGLIHSVEDKVLTYFPQYQIKRGEKTIQQVTIKHLLTMKAPYKYRSEPWSKICGSEDWTKATLDVLGGRKGITNEFFYSTLGIHLLTSIISKQSGMKVVDFANRYLFEPLGIPTHKNYLAETKEKHVDFTISKTPKKNVWFCDPEGIGTAGYGLCLSASDLAKIGELCLNKGCYHNKRIVSEKWMEEMIQVTSTLDEKFRNMSYGYLWWIINQEKKIYAAIGDSGNVIYINSEKEIVVGITAYFKPMVFDRVDFIQQVIEPYLLNLE
jgi:CubicO group peptidase (beta-lactamase class C family)